MTNDLKEVSDELVAKLRRGQDDLHEMMRARNVDHERNASTFSNATGGRQPHADATPVRYGTGRRLSSALLHSPSNARPLRQLDGTQTPRLCRWHHPAGNSFLSESIRDTSLSSVLSLEEQAPRNMPKGYDWIASLLDTSPQTQHGQQEERYYNELMEFRRVNREDCFAPAQPLLKLATSQQLHEGEVLRNEFSSGVSRQKKFKPSAAITDLTGSYTLNDRLLPVPVHGDHDSCAICKQTQTPSGQAAGYIRVSVPRSSLQSPHRWQPWHKCGTDTINSVGLSQHCQAGWQASQPSSVPAAKSVDLMASLRSGNVLLKSSVTMDGEQSCLAFSKPKSTPQLLRQTRLFNLESQRQRLGDVAKKLTV